MDWLDRLVTTVGLVVLARYTLPYIAYHTAKMAAWGYMIGINIYETRRQQDE